MPARFEPFVTGDIYHTFNKTIDHRRIFHFPGYAQLFLDILRYYQSTKITVSFSDFKTLTPDDQRDLQKEFTLRKYFRVDILAYCLMPNHFHLLLRQKKDNGVSRYISDSLNSLTRSYNLRTKRLGPVFLPTFKSAHMFSDEQLLHVSRYIHLNPYTSSLASSFEELKRYPWSSFTEYTTPGRIKNSLSHPYLILSYFERNKKKYEEFVLDNADYQRSLHHLRHLEKW